MKKRVTMKQVWKDAENEKHELRASQLYCEFAKVLIDRIRGEK